MHIVFLARSLDFGGAERQLVLLARGLHERGHRVEVVVFYAGGELEGELGRVGVPVHDLRKRGRWDLFGFRFCPYIRSYIQGKSNLTLCQVDTLVMLL